MQHHTHYISSSMNLKIFSAYIYIFLIKRHLTLLILSFFSSRPNHRHQFVYSIAKAEPHHSGVYTCVAANVYKTITSSTYVTVMK